MNPEARPLTDEEIHAASRERVAEIVWKLKLFNDDELVDLAKRLGDEAPEVLKALQP